MCHDISTFTEALRFNPAHTKLGALISRCIALLLIVGTEVILERGNLCNRGGGCFKNGRTGLRLLNLNDVEKLSVHLSYQHNILVCIGVYLHRGVHLGVSYIAPYSSSHRWACTRLHWPLWSRFLDLMAQHSQTLKRLWFETGYVGISWYLIHGISMWHLSF